MAAFGKRLNGIERGTGGSLKRQIIFLYRIRVLSECMTQFGDEQQPGEQEFALHERPFGRERNVLCGDARPSRILAPKSRGVFRRALPTYPMVGGENDQRQQNREAEFT